MKKRKIKLFASVASLAMVAAVMGVGVWAASQQAVAINSTVGFAATSVDATIKLKVFGTAATGEQTVENILDTAASGSATVGGQEATTTAQQVATITAGDEAQLWEQSVALTIVDTDGNGYLNAGSTITYEFEVASASGFQYSIVVENIQEAFKLDTTTLTGTVTAGAEAQKITLVFSVEEDYEKGITTGTKFADIRINLANNETNLAKAAALTKANN